MKKKEVVLKELFITVVFIFIMLELTIIMAVKGGLFEKKEVIISDLNSERVLQNLTEENGIEDIRDYIGEESYVGYYTDIDGNGSVDGVIYADLLFGQIGDGQWIDSDGTYTINKIENTKNYYISQIDYDGPFGKKDVLRAYGKGNERFYVMALNDVTGRWYWYYNANNMSDFETATSGEFGMGRTNTKVMIEKWEKKIYGNQNTKDMWAQIQEQVNKGWFVPSKEEWSAFGEELGINLDNYKQKGLSIYYWSSTQFYEQHAWRFYLFGCSMNGCNVEKEINVRLSTIF